MNYSAALTDVVHQEVLRHLLRKDGQEDLCFALWHPSRGHDRLTALIAKILIPRDGERRVRGNAIFLPRYFERAISEAVEANAGLAFLHSHLGPGWQDMSGDDIRAEQGHAAAVKGATGLPFVGLTLGTDGAWSARFWEKTAPHTYTRRWCKSVRVVGDQLLLTYHDGLIPKPKPREELQRTVSAWGEDIQATIARLRVGVVGAGSVGAIVAEALARMGVSHVKLIDFDGVEFVNLDRLLYARKLDALLHKSKVACLGRALRHSATAESFHLDEVEYSVGEEEGYRKALDCDVLFSCVDRPWGRSVLNFIAYVHLIPVIDGGILVEVTRDKKLRRADWRAHISGPGRRCMACLGQYDPGLVEAERQGYLDNPEYIKNLPKSHTLRRNENVFAFSLGAAHLQVLQFLMMIIAPLGISNPGAQRYHFVPGGFESPDLRGCEKSCPYPSLIARGDGTDYIVTAPHMAAQRARENRKQADREVPWKYRLAGKLQTWIDRWSG